MHMHLCTLVYALAQACMCHIHTLVHEHMYALTNTHTTLCTYMHIRTLYMHMYLLIQLHTIASNARIGKLRSDKEVLREPALTSLSTDSLTSPNLPQSTSHLAVAGTANDKCSFSDG